MAAKAQRVVVMAEEVTYIRQPSGSHTAHNGVVARAQCVWRYTMHQTRPKLPRHTGGH